METKFKIGEKVYIETEVVGIDTTKTSYPIEVNGNCGTVSYTKDGKYEVNRKKTLFTAEELGLVGNVQGMVILKEIMLTMLTQKFTLKMTLTVGSAFHLYCHPKKLMLMLK